jgi:hypothetical protein
MELSREAKIEINMLVSSFINSIVKIIEREKEKSFNEGMDAGTVDESIV